MTDIFTEEHWEEYAKSNKIIFSSCKDCVFFTSPNQCYCGRLEKFEKNGTKIVDIAAEGKDVDHKIISGRICNMYRPNNWLKALKINDKPTSYLEEAARKEIYIQCYFIIICSDDEDARKISDEKELRRKTKEKIAQIAKTMKDITSSQIQPKEVIILNKSWVKPYDFINYLRIECEEKNIKCKWRLEHFGDKGSGSLEENSFLKNVFKTVKTGYCAVFLEEENIPKNYLNNIDRLLNDELEAFLVLKPKDGISGMFINSVLFKQFLSNKNEYTLEEFFEQVEKITKEQKCPHLIQSLDKIFQRQE